jgi:hypothetical protein
MTWLEKTLPLAPFEAAEISVSLVSLAGGESSKCALLQTMRDSDRE